MFYKLLGMLVWNGVKYYLKRRYGALPTPVLLGLGAAAAAGTALAVLAARRNGSDG